VTGAAEADRDIGPVDRLDFLGPRRLATKTKIYRYWIPLDFLGFSRPKHDLSMGYAGFNGGNFF
jgi:hypothetical protein